VARLRGVAALVVALAVATSVSLGACAEPKAPKAAPAATLEAEHAFDPRAPIVLSLRPMGLRRDEVFGPLVTTLSRLAAARSITGARELEAFESAEELRIAIDEISAGALDGKMSAVVVARGTRADLVPEKILDGDGKLLFKSGHAVGPVVEHEGYAEEPLSLFVLPRRTWVFALGAAASRARSAFVEARPGPKVPFDEGALLELRIDGKNLVAHVPKLERGDLAIGRRLAEATLRLLPSRGGLVLLLDYADVDAAAWAENTLVRVVNAFSRRLEGPLAWLGGTTVVREGTRVRLRAEVPAPVVEALQHLDPSELVEGRVSPPPVTGDAGSRDAGTGDVGGRDESPGDAGTGDPPHRPATRPLPPVPPRPPGTVPPPASGPAPSATGWKLTLPPVAPRDAGVAR